MSAREIENLSYLIDTHCHLDSQSFEDDLNEVIERAFSHNVRKIIIPGADIRTLPKAQAIAHKYEHVYFAAGVHPNDIDLFDMALLQSFAKDKKCIAIGECGLDYYYLPSATIEAEEGDTAQQRLEIKARQKAYFIEQIKLSIALQKPLILHIREASNDAFEILKDFNKAFGVLHCYNADRILLELQERFYYGIGGVCTFKNARRLIEVLPLIPKSRLLLETDAPYLTPHPHRGSRNEPYYIPLIMRQIASVLGMSEEEVCQCSTRNALRLFNI
ncbi:TatD family hydrolase [Helicobacter marmotae]|uniref:TatD family deoxyribonuclease n=1 Tax=Helicobacter marmotae TaxID=152490 RepID=A0A3D8I5R8_9HELI|nr:TatD family hydrolase [Helicobacter marmotae]RDU60315.1 TatD family deoxyribonuclease [Helicobacter marmotae]